MCFVTELKPNHAGHLLGFFGYVAETLYGKVTVESVVPQLCFASAGPGMCFGIGAARQTMHVDEHADPIRVATGNDLLDSCPGIDVDVPWLHREGCMFTKGWSEGEVANWQANSSAVRGLTEPV